MNTNGIDPNLVVSPKGRINNIEVVHNFGAYSVAIMEWCVLQDFPTQYCKEKVHTFAPEIFL